MIPKSTVIVAQVSAQIRAVAMAEVICASILFIELKKYTQSLGKWSKYLILTLD